MLSRRSFLGSVAALPLIGTRTPWLPASERLTVGFIGLGMMGRYHLDALLGRSEIEVVALCDVAKERLDVEVGKVETRYAERKRSGDWKGVAAYGDFRELLAHADLDAVVIATPDHWHTIPCLLAARAKKHIYCEKPLTHTVAEGRRIVTEVAANQVVFQTGSQQRSEFGGHFRRAVEYVWNGRIGKLKTIRIGVGAPPRTCDLPAQDTPEGTNWDLWLGPAPERAYHEVLCPRGVHGHYPLWRHYQEYAGGGLADMGAHHFDIAQWAMEMDGSGPVEVIPPEHPAKGEGLRFVYANGVTMFHNAFEGDVRADCVFEGEDGVILVSRGGLSSRPDSILTEPLGADARRVMPSNDHHTNWIEAIRSSAPTICTAEIGHRSATICHLANLGYRLGRPLHWDPAREQFVKDDEANAQLARVARGEWAKI
jgi:predicted dehydrogenase